MFIDLSIRLLTAIIVVISVFWFFEQVIKGDAGGRPLADELIGGVIIAETQPIDPEYQSILDEFLAQHKSFKASHRDTQWQAVAQALQDIPITEERLALMRNTRNYPFWRQLPATVAISPTDLKNWHTARGYFYDMVKKNLPKLIMRSR